MDQYFFATNNKPDRGAETYTKIFSVYYMKADGKHFVENTPSIIKRGAKLG